jgi:hypothetical protein
VVESRWANLGVAPCHPGGFWALTLKDAKGGVASAHVDESFDFRELGVGPPGSASAKELRSRFAVARGHADPVGWHAPPTLPGTYRVFVSVGARDGTPTIALPLAEDDGARRYEVGSIRVTERRAGEIR